MEQAVAQQVDLFGKDLPTVEQIDELIDTVNCSQTNRTKFAGAVEQNAGNSKAGVGIGLYILGKYKDAIEKLEKAGDCPQKYLYLALAHARHCKYDKAIQSLDKAEKLGLEQLRVNLEKVSIYRCAGNVEAAAEHLKKCANFEGVSADYHYQTARLAETAGDYEKAIGHFQKAIELSPNHRNSLFHLAYRYDICGDEEAAIDYYKRAVANRPAHCNALLNLAVLYEDSGQYNKAMQCVEKVLQYHPNHQRAILFSRDIVSSRTMYYDEEKEKRKTRKNQILETPISDFELSVRSRNCLKKMNINTLGDLLNITEAELLSYKNFGETSLREIKQILETKTLRLGQAVDDGSLPAEGERDIEAEQQENSMMNKPVEELQLSVRAQKCLSRLNIHTFGELTRKTEAELLGCKNFGVTSLNEIKEAMTKFDLSLRTLE
ncbi:MAG: DNA-directed RNA polymerase subunit alpha C-terminal domain-containing protein [Phycisphaerae bacterium]|jgi:DNA-directed RNA polymerase subunit alpha